MDSEVINNNCFLFFLDYLGKFKKPALSNCSMLFN